MTALDRHEFTDQIKAEALHLGFDLVGVTTPDPPPHLDVYESWLAEGRHGTMAYLGTERARDRRANPRLILPECQSILVLAAIYLPHDYPRDQKLQQVQVATYALGEDYHDVLIERMRRLVDFIQTRAGRAVQNRIYTDTGPLLERELAQRAGLGWIGKNSCLIHPKLGSFFVLAEILLDLPLVFDEPFQFDRCGTCTRCIDACPTGCILPNRTLDAQRCISYLTIEEKGAIPAPLRNAIGNWLFGCDVCQQVCPWNQRFAKPTLDPAFQPRPFLKTLNLHILLKLKPQTWRQHLRGSPLLRPKRGGLLRNAAIIAGNQQDPNAIPILIKLLPDDPEAIVRAHVAWALGRIETEESLQALQLAQSLELDPNVILEIEEALKNRGKV